MDLKKTYEMEENNVLLIVILSTFKFMDFSMKMQGVPKIPLWLQNVITNNEVFNIYGGNFWLNLTQYLKFGFWSM